MSAFSDLMAIAPKVALHDHLDGGLRAATVFELASDLGLPLPASDAAGLAIWFYEAADSGSLPRYLETFGLTVAVMLSADNLRRVAREAVEDLASDGVVYAEFRWAPEQHLSGGLTMLDAVRAVADGLDEGMREASEQGRRIEARQLLTTLRQGPPTLDTADLVLQTADLGVVGFDLAGPEAGFPASRHADAVAHVLRHGGHVTIHAGEGDGPASIADALDCGAERIGHGVRLIEDFTPQAGPTARRVLDAGVLLEVCPSSNLQTGIASTMAEHPAGRLAELGVPLAISCDNRLMSRTSLTREYVRLHEAFGWTLADVETQTILAMRHAFCDEALRRELIDDVIVPGYRGL